MTNFFSQEPALLMGLVQAGVILAVSFGLDLNDGQTAAILAFTAALLSVVTRQNVVPVDKAEHLTYGQRKDF